MCVLRMWPGAESHTCFCRPKFAEVLARIQQQYGEHRAALQCVVSTTASRSRPNISYTFDTLEIAQPVPDGSTEPLHQHPLEDDP